MWHAGVVEAAACAGALGEKHKINLFVDGRKGVNNTYQENVDMLIAICIDGYVMTRVCLCKLNILKK